MHTRRRATETKVWTTTSGRTQTWAIWPEREYAGPSSSSETWQAANFRTRSVEPCRLGPYPSRHATRPIAALIESTRPEAPGCKKYLSPYLTEYCGSPPRNPFAARTLNGSWAFCYRSWCWPMVISDDCSFYIDESGTNSSEWVFALVAIPSADATAILKDWRERQRNRSGRRMMAPEFSFHNARDRDRLDVVRDIARRARAVRFLRAKKYVSHLTSYEDTIFSLLSSMDVAVPRVYLDSVWNSRAREEECQRRLERRLKQPVSVLVCNSERCHGIQIADAVAGALRYQFVRHDCQYAKLLWRGDVDVKELRHKRGGA